MTASGKISSVRPPNVLPGGEIEVEFSGIRPEPDIAFGCYVNAHPCRVIAASSKKVIAEVSATFREYQEGANVHIESGSAETDNGTVRVAGLLKDGMHIVANPAVDPKDDAVILTRSGGRGQQLPNTLFRLEKDGYLDELPVEVMNPTAIAFGPNGEMFTTNRRDGVVLRIDGGDEAVVVAKGLGIATGLAFDKDGTMFVGDRSGTIYQILADGTPDAFAKLEPSVAAYHMAFGPDGRLYVSSPGLASHEAIYAIDAGGLVETYFRGFGRPQGLAFGNDGTLYVAACHKGRRGVFGVEYESGVARHVVAGNSIVGLCFNQAGDMIVATGDSVYSLPLDIKGTLI